MVKAIVNDFAENCYIIAANNEAYVIDPGSNYQAMKKVIEKEQLTLKGVLLTHGHYDHISGINDLLEHFDATIYVHRKERDFLFDHNLNLSGQMDKIFRVKDKHRIESIDETKTFSLGNDMIKVVFTPGHTRGGVTFHYQNYLFTGDALFRESIGRTDLPTASENDLLKSIHTLLNTFDDNTICYPGHGHFTTIAHEKMHNPYID